LSEYRSNTTKFTDKDCLIEALIAAGYTREQIEVHDEAVQLYDFYGQATRYIDKTGDKANIIIRRNHIGYGAANDLGFKFNPATKTYDAIVSAYDSSTHHWGAESQRMKTTEQTYADVKIKKTLAKQGFKYLGKKVVNGKIRIQYMDARS
jgi:hypothetical protein